MLQHVKYYVFKIMWKMFEVLNEFFLQSTVHQNIEVFTRGLCLPPRKAVVEFTVVQRKGPKAYWKKEV